MSVTSLCIPRVFSNITAERITGVIESAGFGKVERVDLVQKTNEKGDKFQRAFIHLESWDNTSEAVYHRNEIESGRMVKIVYDQPWFWLIGKSFAPKPDFNKKTPSPTIVFQTANDDVLPITIHPSVQPLLPPHPDTQQTFQQAFIPSSRAEIINIQKTEIDQLKTQIIMLKAQLAMKDNELNELKASITTVSPSIYTEVHDINPTDAPAAEPEHTPAQAEEYEDIEYDSDLEHDIFEDSDPSFVFKKALSQMTHENDW
jgi:hypothetical protein